MDYQCFSNNCSCLIYHTQNFHIWSKEESAEKYNSAVFRSNLARGVTNFSNLTISQVIAVLKNWPSGNTFTFVNISTG